MKRSIDLFQGIQKTDLAVLDSPIDKCHSIGKIIQEMPELYIKRDDFIGSLVWGNKLRKLEYSFAEALDSGADTIITCGGIQSNHARITAQVGKRLGLNVILVLNGEKPAKSVANFLINDMLGIKIHYVNSREERIVRMKEVAAEVSAAGKRIFEIPLGASDETGTLGFVNAFYELQRQQSSLGFTFDYIFHSSSSGGTQAGLEVGKRLFNQRETRIIGVSSDNSVEEISSAILKAANPLMERLGMNDALKSADMNIETGYIGPGYAIPSDQSVEAGVLFAKHEGLLLDQTYTAKAAAAIIDYSRKGFFRKTDKVLFWHTGGLINIFG